MAGLDPAIHVLPFSNYQKEDVDARHKAGHDRLYGSAFTGTLMLHPNFTPDINLGHLVQAGVLIASVAGGVLGGYLGLRADLDRQRAEFRIALAGDEARLAMAERLIDERRAEDRQFQTEMRAALDRVMVTLADIRTTLVQKQDRK
jgi:hypothetical protein